GAPAGAAVPAVRHAPRQASAPAKNAVRPPRMPAREGVSVMVAGVSTIAAPRRSFALFYLRVAGRLPPGVRLGIEIRIGDRGRRACCRRLAPHPRGEADADGDGEALR